MRLPQIEVFGPVVLAPLATCFFVAIGALNFMRIKANMRLPRGDRFSHFLPMTKWNKVPDAYKGLYPGGRADLVLRVSVIGMAVLVATIVLGQFWNAVVTR